MKDTQKYLHEVLTEYSKSDIYPFHMPGHKRRWDSAMNPYAFDMTEVEGVDNLHDPEEVLQKEKNRIRDLYHAKDSFLVMGGSTVGNLASLYALGLKDNDEILIQRNSHKSVYHAVMLNRLKVHYLIPEMDENGIFLAVTKEQVKAAFDKKPGIKAVIITSPTYEGFLCDVASIADICHERGAFLIVDSAHGAHFGVNGKKSPVDQKADLTVMSLHKTLPALTQTAVIHVGSNGVSSHAVQEALDIFDTSSPSYVLMDSVSCCMSLLSEKGKEVFEAYYKRLEAFYEKAKVFKKLELLEADENKKDSGKLVILTKGYITGPELAKILREKYKLETEMSGFDYVLAMTSVADNDEGFERLAKALSEIDKGLEETRNKSQIYKPDINKAKELWEAHNYDRELVAIEKAKNRISASEICVYPPGSPVLMPGETATEAALEYINESIKAGLHVTGIKDGKAWFLKE
ncbi:MAG: aminotransferase class V-fold PLP-dependent enzyme [Pseudobutyrivibrio sp.]|nr:aminotransferase class V-fold PLP-dependent enzyme [Pseudobutyrivibrio sp.]